MLMARPRRAPSPSPTRRQPATTLSDTVNARRTRQPMAFATQIGPLLTIKHQRPRCFARVSPGYYFQVRYIQRNFIRHPLPGRVRGWHQDNEGKGLSCVLHCTGTLFNIYAGLSCFTQVSSSANIDIFCSYFTLVVLMQSCVNLFQ